MMNALRPSGARLLGFLFFLACVPTVHAGIVLDNGPPDGNFAVISDFDSVVQAGIPFTLLEDATITDYHWAGVYAGTPGGDDFTIRLFDSPPGVDPFFEISAGDPGRVDTGLDSVTGADIYAYSFLGGSVALSAGTYFLSIVNDTAGDDANWLWAGSSPLVISGGRTRPADGVAWDGVANFEFSFALTDDAAVIPEPGTAVLLGSGLLLLGSRRRQRV